MKHRNIFQKAALFLVMGSALPSTVAAHGPLHEQIEAVTREIAQFPDSAELYLKRGDLHRYHRDWQAALADFDRADRLAPKLAAVDLYRGKVWFDADLLDKAKSCLDKFLSAAPNDVEGLSTRARVLGRLDEPLAAAADFTQAIARVDTPVPELYLERAQVLSAAQRLDEALAGLDEGMKRLGPIVTLQLYAIDLEIKQQRYEAALARLEKVAAQSPRQEKWLARRGDILLLAGRQGEAHLAFQSALKAIEALPASRRHAKAMIELESKVRTALAVGVIEQ